MTKHISSKPMRIGIDARFYRASTGGIGRYTRELLYHLSQLDRQNEYLVFLTEPDLAEWELTASNFTPVVVKSKHYSISEQTTFLQLLYRSKLDLVHFLHFNHPILYKRPFIATLHDLTPLYFNNSKRTGLAVQARQKVMELVMRNLRSAKKVIAVSEYTADDAERNLKLSHAQMEVIYEGAPASVPLGVGSKKQVYDYLGNKEPYFLFVSQWRVHKGINTLVEAFNLFKAETGLPHKLVLLGKQEAAPESVKEQIIHSPFVSDIITPGFAPESLLPALYAHAEAMIYPSAYEGFGLPLLEAMAQGTPVICAKNTSLVEVGGDAVLFFETKNAQDLKAKMMEFMSVPRLREELRERGWRQLKQFQWEETARRTLAVYRSVLEKLS